MTESGGVLIFLAIVLVVFVIVLAFIFIGTGRLRQPRQKEPVVGTDNEQSATDSQKLQPRASEGAMDEDVGGNLDKVPEEVQETRREGRS